MCQFIPFNHTATVFDVCVVLLKREAILMCLRYIEAIYNSLTQVSCRHVLWVYEILGIVLNLDQSSPGPPELQCFCIDSIICFSQIAIFMLSINMRR